MELRRVLVRCRDEIEHDVDVEGADGARVAVLGLAEGADGGHGVSPSVCQVAPIAALTAIGQATAGRQHRLRPQRSGGPASAKNLWARKAARRGYRSEEHTSELQSLMRISYAVFCL